MRERWLNNLDPSLNLGPWSDTENQMLLAKYDEFGSAWRKVQDALPGRTDIACRNQFNKLTVHEMVDGVRALGPLPAGTTLESQPIRPLSVPRDQDKTYTMRRSPPTDVTPSLNELKRQKKEKKEARMEARMLAEHDFDAPKNRPRLSLDEMQELLANFRDRKENVAEEAPKGGKLRLFDRERIIQELNSIAAPEPHTSLESRAISVSGHTAGSAYVTAATGAPAAAVGCDISEGDLVSVIFSTGSVDGGLVTAVGIGPNKDEFRAQWPGEVESWLIKPALHKVPHRHAHGCIRASNVPLPENPSLPCVVCLPSLAGLRAAYALQFTITGTAAVGAHGPQVEEILEARQFKGERREFKVRWKGADTAKDSWQHYKSERPDFAKVHDNSAHPQHELQCADADSRGTSAGIGRVHAAGVVAPARRGRQRARPAWRGDRGPPCAGLLGQGRHVVCRAGGGLGR
jgi:hypothetical protein